MSLLCEEKNYVKKKIIGRNDMMKLKPNMSKAYNMVVAISTKCVSANGVPPSWVMLIRALVEDVARRKGPAVGFGS